MYRRLWVNSCRFDWPARPARMKFCSKGNDSTLTTGLNDLEPETSAGYRVSLRGGNHHGSGHRAGVQGCGRARDQEGAGVARQNGGEPLRRAVDPNPDQLRTLGTTAF